MNSLARSVWEHPLTVKSLYTGTTLGLGVVSGIAICLYRWVIPIIQQSPTSRAKLAQFKIIIDLGARYLQSYSRISAAIVASSAYLWSKHPNATIASQWTLFAAASITMVTVGPYEIITIFPTNDILLDWGAELERAGKDNFGDKRDQEIDALLVKWQKWHMGRFILSFAAVSLLVWSSISIVPL